MTMDIRLIKEMREEAIREVEANRLGKSLREDRGRETLAASFMREVRLDFVRLIGAIRVSGKVARRKGRL